MRTPLFRLSVIVVFTFVTLSVAWMYDRTPSKNPDPNHAHADFAVWMNGTQWDFAQAKYMSGASDEDHTKPHADDKDPYFHMHDGNGHVLHSHKPGLPISEFLSSIDWTITTNCITTDTGEKFCNGTGDKKWRVFVNGKEQALDPTFSFKDLDKILYTYSASQEQIAKELAAMTDDACTYSKTCPWRGPAPTESCISDPAIPCRE